MGSLGCSHGETPGTGGSAGVQPSSRNSEPAGCTPRPPPAEGGPHTGLPPPCRAQGELAPSALLGATTHARSCVCPGQHGGPSRGARLAGHVCSALRPDWRRGDCRAGTAPRWSSERAPSLRRAAKLLWTMLGWWIQVTAHPSSPVDHTALRVSPNVNPGLWVTVICPCRVISVNRRPAPVGVSRVREAVRAMGGGCAFL